MSYQRTQIISEFLDISKIESGETIILEKVEVDILGLINKVVESEKLENGNFIFDYEQPIGPIKVWIDKD